MPAAPVVGAVTTRPPAAFSSVTAIAAGAFSDSAVETAVLPPTLTSIEPGAFSGSALRTLWLYDSKDDTVLLSDSGNPDHNLQRIPLRYIYDALKKVSRRQYMIITEVDENGNTWGHDGIDIRWRKPRYYKTMGLY